MNAENLKLVYDTRSNIDIPVSKQRMFHSYWVLLLQDIPETWRKYRCFTYLLQLTHKMFSDISLK